jgi:hypothetical protein
MESFEESAMRHMLSFVLGLFFLAATAFAADSATATAPSSTQPADVAGALKAAKGIALIEVTAVRERDSRPVDGDLVDNVSFKAVKTTGKVPVQIVIIKDFGGLRPGPAPKPAGPLYPNPLVAGQRYWMIFNDTDSQKYQQGVVAWWPEKSVPAAVEAAVTSGTLGK